MTPAAIALFFCWTVLPAFDIANYLTTPRNPWQRDPISTKQENGPTGWGRAIG